MRKFQVRHNLTQEQILEANINEILFYPDDGFPLSVGYIIGEDDGKSLADVTPDEAYESYLKMKQNIK